MVDKTDKIDIEQLLFNIRSRSQLPEEILVDQAFCELCTYYEKQTIVKYAPVSVFVYKANVEGPDLADFLTAFEQAVDTTYKNKNISNNCYKHLSKVIDHIQLAIVQNDNIKRVNEKIKELNEIIEKQHVEQNKITKGIEVNKKALESVQNLKKNVYTDFISILGIFSALIFGLFGGFDTFKDILQSITSSVRVANSLAEGSLLILGLILLIFLLLHSIGIITQRNFLACGCANTSKCPHSLFKRYPIFILGLLTFSSIFLISSVIIVFNAHGWIGIHNEFAGKVLFIIAIVMLILELVVSFWNHERKAQNHKVSSNKAPLP